MAATICGIYRNSSGHRHKIQPFFLCGDVNEEGSLELPEYLAYVYIFYD